MGIIGEKTVNELNIGDTIAIQSRDEQLGYSVHTIERIDREGDYVVLFGSNLMEMALYLDQLISLSDPTP